MSSKETPQFEIDEKFRQLVANTARSMLDHDATPRAIPPELESSNLPLGHIAFNGDFDSPPTQPQTKEPTSKDS